MTNRLKVYKEHGGNYRARESKFESEASLSDGFIHIQCRETVVSAEETEWRKLDFCKNLNYPNGKRKSCRITLTFLHTLNSFTMD